jgi:protein-S-isoprenylcysteine O-methyltransferase Ste14
MNEPSSEMPLSDELAFWSLLTLGPIPLWHLLLHAFLPVWKRRPGAFYGLCALTWALFVPVSLVLARTSDSLFTPSKNLQLACLGVTFLTTSLCAWSVLTLTPQRFFFWAVLRPDRVRPARVVSGPYRYVRHPAYLALVLTIAAGFAASGKAVVLAELAGMALILTLVAGLERRELEARLNATSATS